MAPPVTGHGRSGREGLGGRGGRRGGGVRSREGYPTLERKERSNFQHGDQKKNLFFSRLFFFFLEEERTMSFPDGAKT